MVLIWSLMACQALTPDSPGDLEKWGANKYSEAPGNIKSGSNLEKVKWIAWNYGEYLNNNGEYANANLISRGLEKCRSGQADRMTCGDLAGKLDYILRGSGIFKNPDQGILFIQATKQEQWYSAADVNFDHGVLAIIDKGQVYTFDLWMYADSHLAQFFGFRGSKWNGMSADDWETKMKSLGYVNFAINGMEPISGSLHQLLVDSGRLTSTPAGAETSEIAINGLAKIMSTTGAYTVQGNSIIGGPDLLGFTSCLCSCGCSEAGWSCGYNVICKYEPSPDGDCLCAGFGAGHAPMSTSGECYDSCAQKYNIKEMRSAKTPLGPVVPGQGGNIEDGDTLQTTGDAVVLLQDGSKLLVKSNSILTFTSPKQGVVRVQLHQGDLRVSSPAGGTHGLEVQRGDKIIRPKGTEFVCKWDGDTKIGRVIVIEGSLSISNETSQEMLLEAGEQIDWPGDTISPYDLSTDDGGLIAGIPLRDLPLNGSEPEPFGDYEPGFAGGSVPEDWLWQDPGSDALMDSLQLNTLMITVPDENDLWGHPGTTAGQRSDAPRLLHKVTGDFDLQGEVFVQTDATDMASVELLLYSPGAYLGLESGQMKQDLLGEHYRILGGGWLRTEGLDKLLSLNKPTKITYSGYYLKDAPNAPSEPVLLKLTRRGDVWKTYQSLDGKLWSLSSREEINAPETVWVGWVFKRMAYDGMASEPAIFTLRDVRLGTAPRDSLPVPDWDTVTFLQAGTAEVQSDSAHLALDGSAPGTVSVQRGKSIQGDFDASVSFRAEEWMQQPGEYRSLALVASSDNGQNRTYMSLAQPDGLPSQRYSTDLGLNDYWPDYAYKDIDDFSGRLRIVRQGGNISTYYWSGGDWVKLGDFGTGFSDPAYIGWEVSNEKDATANASLSVEFNIDEIKGAGTSGEGSTGKGSTSGEMSPGKPVSSPSSLETEPGTETETEIFDNWNVGGVENKPSCSPSFTIFEPYMITYIDTYHWNYGEGTEAGGFIDLISDDGTMYGPWEVEAQPGMNGVPNAWWVVRPNEVIPAGTYTIEDIEPETWSQNAESGGCGFSKVEGSPAG